MALVSAVVSVSGKQVGVDRVLPVIVGKSENAAGRD
jgi:hypothetical protein